MLRPHLSDKLAAVLDHPNGLALRSGPASFGKTTLLGALGVIGLAEILGIQIRKKNV